MGCVSGISSFYLHAQDIQPYRRECLSFQASFSINGYTCSLFPYFLSIYFQDIISLLVNTTRCSQDNNSTTSVLSVKLFRIKFS